MVFFLWVKILQNTGAFKFCLHLYIKQRILKIFNLKTFTASYHLKEDLRVYTDLYGKLHEQYVSDNDKDVQV